MYQKGRNDIPDHAPSMNRLLVAPRVLALISIALLGIMMLMGSLSEPSEVTISELAALDEGDTVSLRGVLVDMWRADSGSETLLLVDLSDNSTVRVIWLPCGGPTPSETVSIGDEVRVQGDVSPAQMPPVVFARGHAVWLVRPSEAVISVWALSDHWALFENDRIRVAGVLSLDPSTRSFRLCDPDMQHTVLLRYSDEGILALNGERVLTTAVLRMDARTMSLVLVAEELARLV